MGAADIRDAFNLVARPAYDCVRATLNYERKGGTEFQRLTFAGRRSDGNAFEVRSELLRPGTDANIAAREVAQKLLDKKEPLT